MQVKPTLIPLSVHRDVCLWEILGAEAVTQRSIRLIEVSGGQRRCSSHTVSNDGRHVV